MIKITVECVEFSLALVGGVIGGRSLKRFSTQRCKVGPGRKAVGKRSISTERVGLFGRKR